MVTISVIQFIQTIAMFECSDLIAHFLPRFPTCSIPVPHSQSCPYFGVCIITNSILTMCGHVKVEKKMNNFIHVHLTS